MTDIIQELEGTPEVAWHAYHALAAELIKQAELTNPDVIWQDYLPYQANDWTMNRIDASIHLVDPSSKRKGGEITIYRKTADKILLTATFEDVPVFAQAYKQLIEQFRKWNLLEVDTPRGELEVETAGDKMKQPQKGTEQAQVDRAGTALMPAVQDSTDEAKRIDELVSQVPDNGYNRQMLQLWHLAWPTANIARRLGKTNPRTITNRLSYLRKIHGERIVPLRRV